MLKPEANVADNLIRLDLTPCGTVKIGNSGRRDLQALKLLLRDRVSYGPHVALSVLLVKRNHDWFAQAPAATCLRRGHRRDGAALLPDAWLPAR